MCKYENTTKIRGGTCCCCSTTKLAIIHSSKIGLEGMAISAVVRRDVPVVFRFHWDVFGQGTPRRRMYIVRGLPCRAQRNPLALGLHVDMEEDEQSATSWDPKTMPELGWSPHSAPLFSNPFCGDPVLRHGGREC